MQVETMHTQQESIYQQNLSTERQTLLFVDSDSEIELADAELVFIYGGRGLTEVPNSGPSPTPSPPNSGPTHNQNGQSSF